MKAVMLAVQPKWCEKIANEEKKVEVRKTAPKQVPFKCYIYCSKDNANEIVLLKNYKNRFIFGDYRNADGHFYTIANGKVIGEFICDKIDEIVPDYNPVTTKFYYGYVADTEATCLSEEELQKYGKNKSLYFWHISDLKIYDKPKELHEFKRECPKISIKRADCITCPFEYYEPHKRVSSCDAYLKRPPQSWQYVEELQE
jgi:predicted transcriptional regulator